MTLANYGFYLPSIVSRLCIPLLAAGNSTTQSPGTIINFSSTRAYQSEPDHEAYSAAKAGLLGHTQSMSISLGHRHDIRVNAVIPGWIHVANECKKGDEEAVEWQEGLSKEDIAWHGMDLSVLQSSHHHVLGNTEKLGTNISDFAIEIISV